MDLYTRQQDDFTRAGTGYIMVQELPPLTHHSLESTHTMNINAAFPTKFIKAADLQGKDVNLTITRFDEQDVVGDNDPKDFKKVLSFSGTKQMLVLNKTNGKMIATFHGDETDNWIGKRVTLYPTTCMFGSETKDCIRVREVPPAAIPPNTTTNAPVAPPAPINEDDIPF